MKLTRAAHYLLCFSLFLSGAIRSARLMHGDGDASDAFGQQRAMRAANARACYREWRFWTANAQHRAA